MICGNLLTIC